MHGHLPLGAFTKHFLSVFHFLLCLARIQIRVLGQYKCKSLQEGALVCAEEKCSKSVRVSGPSHF